MYLAIKFLVVVINSVNLSEATELLDAVSDFHFNALKKKPDFSIYDNQKEGYTLWIKTNLVSEEYRKYLEEIVKSYKLGIRESNGYLIIHSY